MIAAALTGRRALITPASGPADGVDRACLRKDDRPRATAPTPIPDDAPEAESEERRAIVCARCGAEITSRDLVVEVDGSHEHTFFNPAGLLFEIGCFAEASGALDLGPTSAEFSWFPGYAWRFGLCRACRSHLGWRFVSASGDSFWGLILNKLVEG